MLVSDFAGLVVNFGGVVHPQAGNWRLYGPVNVRRELADLRISLVGSSFSVRAIVHNPPAIETKILQDFMTRLWYDTDATVMSVLDALGYCLGAPPLQLELITGSIEGRDALIFGKKSMSDLAIVGTDEVPGEVLTAYLGHAVTNVDVRHALADIRMAAAFSEDCFFYCYRAVESMRQHYVDPQDNNQDRAKKRSWLKLREELDVDEADLRALQSKANERRHGGDAASQFKDRHDTVLMVRALFRKFIATLPPPPPMPQFDT